MIAQARTESGEDDPTATDAAVAAIVRSSRLRKRHIGISNEPCVVPRAVSTKLSDSTAKSG